MGDFESSGQVAVGEMLASCFDPEILLHHVQAAAVHHVTQLGAVRVELRQRRVAQGSNAGIMLSEHGHALFGNFLSLARRWHEAGGAHRAVA